MPDLVVLDLGLPSSTASRSARACAPSRDVPILILTARTETEDRVEGLDSGADDYLVKPFERQELLARTPRADAPAPAARQRRRSRSATCASTPTPARSPAASAQIELTNREFELLEYLMRNEQLVVSRERLLEEVWGYDPMAMTNTIDVFISNLRRKLEEGGEDRASSTPSAAPATSSRPAPSRAR